MRQIKRSDASAWLARHRRSRCDSSAAQLAPMVDKIAALPDEVGWPDRLLADGGYLSSANVEACANAGL